MLKITETAREQFQEVLRQNPDKVLRVVFEGFGWGGPRLGLALDEPQEGQKRYTVNQIDLLIADEVLPFAKGNQIDYVNSSYRQGFIIAPEKGGNCN